MRIAHFHADLPGESHGGVAHQVHRLANALARLGHEITVFTMSPAPPDARYDVRTIPVPRSLWNSAAGRLALAGIGFARQRPTSFDVLHFHGDNHLVRSTVPCMRTFYGSALDEMLHATSWRFFLGQLLTYPMELVGSLMAHRSVGISRVTGRSIPFLSATIPCGVDLDVFRPGSGRSVDPSILFVGTVDGRKRGRLLLESFENTVRRALPRASLWLVCDDRVVADGVVSFGRVGVERLAELYRTAWAFCLPSSYEGFGVPYVEALASGTPVVATPNPGAREILDEGRFGLLSPPQELGDALIRLLTDAALRERLSADGLARARDYSIDGVARAYERIYTELIAGREQLPAMG